VARWSPAAADADGIYAQDCKNAICFYLTPEGFAFLQGAFRGLDPPFEFFWHSATEDGIEMMKQRPLFVSNTKELGMFINLYAT